MESPQAGFRLSLYIAKYLPELKIICSFVFPQLRRRIFATTSGVRNQEKTHAGDQDIRNDF
jgi:hypothetical protein